MRLDARRAAPVLVLALVACAGGAAPRPEETSTQSASTAAPSETRTAEASTDETSTGETSTGEASMAETSTEEPAPIPSVESATCFTQVSFDLRSLPHRGPRDVDSRLVSGRVELLAQRVRDSAGEPPPRILVYPGASVFRAEFFGTEREALLQCQRAVDAVAERGDVRATSCARVEPDGVLSSGGTD